jgi:site-specific recombinase XerD
MAEVERLLTVGTEGNLRARAFLSCVYGGGLRLSEATHIRIPDLDGVRHRLLVFNAKGGRQRYTLLSDNLLTLLREYYRQFRPTDFLFPGVQALQPMNKSTGQSLFYGAVAKAKLPDRGGIHCLRHSFATHCLENGIEITVVQTLLGHASLHTTAPHSHLGSIVRGRLSPTAPRYFSYNVQPPAQRLRPTSEVSSAPGNVPPHSSLSQPGPLPTSHSC